MDSGHNRIRTVLSALTCGVLLVFGCAETREVVRLEGTTMGTVYAISYGSAAAVAGASEVGQLVDDLLEEINASLSTYIGSSLVSEINNSRDPLVWHPVDRHFEAVLERALYVHAATEGAFNPAVGPLVDAWGFGPAGPTEFPDQADIDALIGLLDPQVFELRAAPGAVRKTKPDARLDFSAIAKGYAVDQVSELLESFGVDGYLVDIGGEVRTGGRHPDGRAWIVGIERPAEQPGSSRAPHALIELTDMALATSGTYRNFLERDGQRVVHIVDPSTGRPETSSLLSVSVLAADAMSADAYATALMVLGPEAGMRLVEEIEGIEAYFIAAGAEGRFMVTRSSGFPEVD